MKKSLAVLFAITSVGLGGCASMSGGSAVSAVDQILSQAATELAAVRKTGHVWLVFDKTTGSGAVSVGKLYAAASAARDKGDDELAARLARKVIWSSRAGQEQAKNIATTAEYYTNY